MISHVEDLVTIISSTYIKIKIVDKPENYVNKEGSLLVEENSIWIKVMLSFFKPRHDICLRSYITLCNLQTWLGLEKIKPSGCCMKVISWSSPCKKDIVYINLSNWLVRGNDKSNHDLNCGWLDNRTEYLFVIKSMYIWKSFATKWDLYHWRVLFALYFFWKTHLHPTRVSPYGRLVRVNVPFWMRVLYWVCITFNQSGLVKAF